MVSMTDLVCRRTGLKAQSVAGCVKLLDEGNTVPFIARYRKEMTGSLDEIQIRLVAEALQGFKELEKRKETVLGTIRDQGKLTPDLERRIRNCFDRQELEDLYLPYKPRRRSRADIAREAGLGPLAEMILGRRQCHDGRLGAARKFVAPDKGVESADDALAGARDIVAEELATVPAVRTQVRRLGRDTARIVVAKKRGADEEKVRAFADYVKHEEHFRRMPAHRFLAVARGEEQGALSPKLEVDPERGLSICRGDHLRRVPHTFRQDFVDAAEDGWKRLLWPAVQRELLAAKKEEADAASVRVFEENLRALLMTPPMRGKRVLALDPGFRNGCKVAVVDATGKNLATATVYPHPPQNRASETIEKLIALARRHRVEVCAVGDGTAHRETMALLRPVQWPQAVEMVPVREAGASVYSASPLAAAELPQLDVTLRGAVSIARRLQDPLAELVKIEPKSIGVGQYQHDVDQKMLAAGLDAVVEECVNRVGTEVNTASPALLAHVAGIGPKLAETIVRCREEKGPFRTRQALLKVPGLGQSRFTQCAGFLRIREGDQPLDATGIHPERYALVSRLARELGLKGADLVGNTEAARKLRESVPSTDDAGAETLADIVRELEKPGHDPRGERKEFNFAEGVDKVDDLRPGMVLPGRVNSITDFGVFVDIGVHRDGLVHISQMADRRISSPFEICKPQQEVRVKVIDVDHKRNRISLTMKPSELGD
jgi:protein Tex